jgi:hypothetical protein
MPAKLCAYILLIVGGLPLSIYPIVLIANVMSLAAERSDAKSGSVSLLLVVKAFLWSSTAYPLVYIPCGLIAFKMIRAGRLESGMWLATAPVVLLVLIVLLLLMWMRMGKG